MWEPSGKCTTLSASREEWKQMACELLALQWRPITEQDLPKVGQVVAGFDAGRIVLIGVIHAAYGPIKESQCLLAQGYTHFCSIAPPADKAGA
jgi:hypothetical protein